YLAISGSLAGILLAVMSAAVAIRVMYNRRRMEWEIPFDELSLEDEIGQGTYGIVYKATRRGGPVAVKQLFSSQPTCLQRREFEKEARQLKRLRHTNILGLLGVVTKPQLAIVTHRCYKSLFDVLHTKKKRIFGERKVFDFCKQIARGMNFLHSENPPVLHRDLKSKNVLFFDESCTTLVICDFGLAIKATRAIVESSSEKAQGTVRWM
ncbi:b-Raf proto-oncogene serine/threonine-protein kinase, partial [Aphelenchoides avenae]